MVPASSSPSIATAAASTISSAIAASSTTIAPSARRTSHARLIDPLVRHLQCSTFEFGAIQFDSILYSLFRLREEKTRETQQTQRSASYETPSCITKHSFVANRSLVSRSYLKLQIGKAWKKDQVSMADLNNCEAAVALSYRLKTILYLSVDLCTCRCERKRVE